MKLFDLLYNRVRMPKGLGHILSIHYFGRVRCKRVREYVITQGSLWAGGRPWQDFPNVVTQSWHGRPGPTVYSYITFAKKRPVEDKQYGLISLFTLNLVDP